MEETKEIKRITATYDDSTKAFPVVVGEVDGVHGVAYVSGLPADFDREDDIDWQRGFFTSYKNLRDVEVQYADGSKDYKGSPHRTDEMMPIYLVVKDQKEVLA